MKTVGATLPGDAVCRLQGWGEGDTLLTISIIGRGGGGPANYQARARSARARRACALRALGLLLADGTPTVGGGKTF